MDLTGVRWEAVTEISRKTTARGPAEELLPRLQAMPGFGNEGAVAALTRLSG